MGFVTENRERLAVFFGRAIGAGQGDFCFALQDGHWSAEFVRGVGYESALLFEGFFEAVEQFVEGKGECAEFVARIRDFEAFAEAGCAHAAGLRGHVCDRGEAFPSEEIAAGAGEKQGDRDDPVKRVADVLHDFFLRMKGLQNHKGDGVVLGFQQARVAPESVFPAGNILKCARAGGRRGACQGLKLFGGKNLRSEVLKSAANCRQIQGAEYYLALIIYDREDDVAKAMLDHGYSSRLFSWVLTRGVFHLGVERGDKGVSQFEEIAVRALQAVVPVEKVGEAS
jgi:hypothetical protein